VNALTNKFYFNDGTSDLVITLANSNYDIDGLIYALQTALNAAGSALTFTVTYSNETLKTTITGSGSFTISAGVNSVYTLLGFVAPATGTALVGTNAINLSAPTYIILNIDGFSTGAISTNDYDHGSFVCFAENNGSDILTFNAGKYNLQKIYSTNDNIQNLHVRLSTYGGASVDLNGLHWSALLRLNY